MAIRNSMVVPENISGGRLRRYLIATGALRPAVEKAPEYQEPTPCRYPGVDVHPLTGQVVLRELAQVRN